MVFKSDNISQEWIVKYELAKIYYEHYGHLEIPYSFKTINGYEFDDNGVKLGNWIHNQRCAYKGMGRMKIIPDQIELLEQIGMRFENKIVNKDTWDYKYSLAAKFYEYYGHLEIPYSFKTINGYDYDETGISLGAWINKQRNAYRGFSKGKLSDDRIELLKKIGMRFAKKQKAIYITWEDSYELAKAYYEHYGHLEIDKDFKTKNGYEYDDNGFELGVWIAFQKQKYNSHTKVLHLHRHLLEQIGMQFEKNETNDVFIDDYYTLAKNYFKEYGNLNIPARFKTNDGIHYDKDGIALGLWINTKRTAYKGKNKRKISYDEIRMLEDIGMEWFLKNTDKKLQEEEITSDNIFQKQKEILNRFRSLLKDIESDYDYIEKDELNNLFIKKLNK